MKAAIVTYAINVGGMESILLSLARALRGHGIDSRFIVTDSIGPWHGRVNEEGFQIEAVLPSPWSSRRNHARRLAAILADYDVVLLNHSRPAQSAAGLLPEGTVALSVLHNNDEEIYQLGLANQMNIDGVVAVGDRVRDEAAKRGVSLGKLVCIRNGVEVFPSFPKQGRRNADHGPLKVIYLGRVVHKQKGVLSLPRIISMARNAGVSLSLGIVGDGPDLGLLKKSVNDEQLTDLVIFHGPLQHSRAMELLLDADVLIMPSHYEGQPITLFEGMARGVVPVVSRLEGITDTIVEEGQTGFLPAAGDEKAFASALVRLADGDLTLKMSHEAWKAAAERFSIESMALSYLRLIDQCRGKRALGFCPDRSQTIDDTILGRYPQFPVICHHIGRKLERVLTGNLAKGFSHGN